MSPAHRPPMSPSSRRRARVPGSVSPLTGARTYKNVPPQCDELRNTPRSKSLDTGLDEVVEEITSDELVKECEQYLADSSAALNTDASEAKESDISNTTTTDSVRKVDRPLRRKNSRNKSFEKRSLTKTDSSDSQASLKSEDENSKRKKSLLHKMKTLMNKT